MIINSVFWQENIGLANTNELNNNATWIEFNTVSTYRISESIAFWHRFSLVLLMFIYGNWYVLKGVIKSRPFFVISAIRKIESQRHRMYHTVCEFNFCIVELWLSGRDLFAFSGSVEEDENGNFHISWFCHDTQNPVIQDFSYEMWTVFRCLLVSCRCSPSKNLNFFAVAYNDGCVWFQKPTVDSIYLFKVETEFPLSVEPNPNWKEYSAIFAIITI